MYLKNFEYIFLGHSRNDESNWPRLVEQPIKRSHHVICRFCTHNGKLEEVVARQGSKETQAENLPLYKHLKHLYIGAQAKIRLEPKPDKEDTQLELNPDP
jgi:hypothetical protein